jgi:hypothetical protein
MEVVCGPSKRNPWAMTDRAAFLHSLKPLKELLLSDSSALEAQIERAYIANPWFIPAFTKWSIVAIAEEFLDAQKCEQWMSSYPVSAGGQKRIAVIMAGNLPLVGFHDLFCILASGHSAVIKLSERDTTLLPWITEQWIKIYPALASRITYTERFEGYDAVIATGSNNSGRYFEYYFRSYPHILRQNRNGVAVLTGNETMDDLRKLTEDIFLYFGFGCRNVSKIFIPEGYDFDQWNEATAAWKYLEDHNKYKNNLEYNFAIFIINSIPHIQLGHLILKEDDAIASRIGCLHYSYYTEREQLLNLLQSRREEIQCVISLDAIEGWEHVGFGESQSPRLDQYADGVDTMKFLASL